MSAFQRLGNPRTGASRGRRKALGVGVISVCVLVLLVLSSLVWAAPPEPIVDTWANENITRISTMSDVHIGDTNNRARLRLLLEKMRDFHPQMLIISGDTYTGSYSAPATDPYGIGATSFTSSYDEIRQAAYGILGAQIPVVISAGNHAYDAGATYYTSNSGFSSYYGLVPTRNFDCFLFGQPDGGGMSWNYSSEQITALGSYLSERAEPNKPVFVIGHAPLDDTATGEHPGAGNAATVVNVLAAYDQPSFFLWGHNHQNAANRTDIATLIKEYESGYTTMNAGAIGYRNPSSIAQGMNMTLDSTAGKLDCTVIRVDTGNPDIVTTIGTRSIDLPPYTPQGGQGVWDGSIATSYAGGSGTQADPYLISNGAELAHLAQQVNGGTAYTNTYFRQTADIDLGGHEWTPIGVFAGSSSTYNRQFSGSYEGDGHLVSNLKIDQTYTGSSNNPKAWALFGHLNGTVTDLGLTKVDVYAHNDYGTSGSSANAYAGGIAGVAAAGARVYNSFTEGVLRSRTATTGNQTVSAAGGIAARAQSGALIGNSYAAVEVSVTTTGWSGSPLVGGLVGYNQMATNAYTTCYWDASRTAPGVQNGTGTSGTSSRTTAQMKAAEFVTQLNAGRTTYKEWMADTPGLNDGYPIYLREAPPVDAEAPTITAQPQDANVSVGAPVTLSVTATVPRGELSYQWYSNATNDNTGGTEIGGATGQSYSPSTATLGTVFYYCVVTNTDTAATGAQTATVATRAARVRVSDTSGAWDGQTATPFSGNGTQVDPYLISNGAELAYLAQQVNAAANNTPVYSGECFRQTADIDLGGHEWTPIGLFAGSTSTPLTHARIFGGIYDGDGHVISNLKIDVTYEGDSSNRKAWALFGNLGGVVQDLGVTGVDVRAANTQSTTSNGQTNAYVGGIAGYMTADGRIRNSYAQGSLQAITADSGTNTRAAAGGVAARTASGSQIVNSYGAVNAQVSFGSRVGGLVGYHEGTFTTSFWDSTRTTNGSANSGGTGTTTPTGASGRTTAQMKAAGFVTELNAGHGTYKEWMADTPGLNDGYPIHWRIVEIIDALPPQITAQPQSRTVMVGAPATLSVTATVPRGVLSYQWYSNTVDSNSGGTLISGATDSSYTAPTGSVGETYYYCVVTNTDAEAPGVKTASTTSATARIRVTTTNIWDGQTVTPFGGSGTQADPYLISNGAELAYLAQQVNAAANNTPVYSGQYFRQTADIDLGGHEWTPIGLFAGTTTEPATYARIFGGIYEGDGYVVSNLKIDQTYSGNDSNRKAWALFGHLSGTVQNLGVTGVDIRAENTLTGSVSAGAGNAYTGGITGFVTASGRIFNSYAEGELTSVTGISGSNTYAVAGGVAARTATNAQIVNCYGAVTATTIKAGNPDATHQGGLVGHNAGTFTTSYWDASRTAPGVQNGTNTSGTSGRTTAEMKAAGFVTQLNNGRGTYKEWMADTPGLNDGYPIHFRETGTTSISTATIAPIPDQTWTGSPIEPSVTVTLGGVTLVRGTDYTVAYSGNTAVGTATVTVTGIGNYSGQVQTTFAIVQARVRLTVTATAADKVYDGTRTATVTLASADIAAGDQVTLSYGQALFDTKHVGTAKTVTVSGITISGPDAGDYELQNESATASAAISALTVSGGFTAADKVYDGTTTAVVTARHLNGVLSDDDVSLSGGSGAFGDKSVGSAKTVVLSGASLSGPDAGDYRLGSVDTALAAITAAELTVSGLTAADKTYDGTRVATVGFGSAALVGVVEGDAVSLDHSGHVARFADKHVGVGKPVTVTGLVLSGADAGNYRLTAPELSAAITARSLAVTATASDKVYDGTTAATVTLASADLVAGDAVTFDWATALFDTKDVGAAKPVTVSGITLTGTDAANYVLQSASAAASAAITPAPLTITARDLTKPFNTALSFRGDEFLVDGLLADDAVTAVSLSSTGAAKTALPGKHEIVVGDAEGSGLGNYEITYVPGTLTVSKGYSLPAFLKPLRQVDARKFRRGATIRVAFRVKDANGKNTAAAKPVLSLKQGGTVLVKAKAVKYDKAKKLYIFQLKTKPGWKIAKYKLTVRLGAGSKGRSVFFRLTK